jgi:hypothetical protein
MGTSDKNANSTSRKNSSPKSNKDKAMGDGGKDINTGGAPAADKKGGKGTTTGSRGTQGKS